MTKGITRAGIVATALQLLDEQGIHAVTARALADRLGVRAPALYWHIGSKQEILDEMATEVHRRVARQIEAELDGDGWRSGLATYARVLRREYLRHRDGARTFSGARVTDVGVLRAQESLLSRWTDSGIPLADVGAAGQLLTSFVVGFVIEEQERAQSGGEGYSIAAKDDVVGTAVPNVAEVGRSVLTPYDERFERYVEIILSGLEATLSR
jgi:TetR/AcrR family transcriptional regulator, tetracycline repressor protein